MKKTVTHQTLMPTCQVGFNDNTWRVVTSVLAHLDYKDPESYWFVV